MSDEKPETKAPAEVGAPGSAPETKEPRDSHIVGSVDTNKQQQPNGSVNADRFGLKKQLERVHDRKRDVEQENARLLERLAALEKSNEETKREKVEQSNTVSLDGPIVDRIKREAVAEARRAIAEDHAESQRITEVHAAENWLLSRSNLIEDPSLTEAINKRIQERYMRTASVDPMSAAKQAYFDVCESLGIEPDMAKKSNSVGASATVKPSSAGGGRGSIEYGPADIGKVPKEEIVKAVKEGRWKGKVISFGK